MGKAPREQIARPLSKPESERGEALKIGFIGAGRIGRPILDQLARAGHECVVLARRPETKAVLQRDGLVCADTLTAAVTEADVVFVVVLNDEQVQAVCLGAAGALAAMKPGAALVQHTTCDPTTVQLIATEGAGRVRVLDAALSGGPDDIAAGRLTLWVGGDEDLRNQLQPLLKTYASPIIPVGALGNGQRVKLINNALFVAHVGLAIDAVRIAAMLDIDEQAILAAVQHGSGASRGLSVVAGAGPVSSVAERLGDLMLKDVNVVRQVAARAGVDLGIIGTVLSSSPDGSRSSLTPILCEFASLRGWPGNAPGASPSSFSGASSSGKLARAASFRPPSTAACAPLRRTQVRRTAAWKSK